MLHKIHATVYQLYKITSVPVTAFFSFSDLREPYITPVPSVASGRLL